MGEGYAAIQKVKTSRTVGISHKNDFSAFPFFSKAYIYK
jgi:hypothetical protein